MGDGVGTGVGEVGQEWEKSSDLEWEMVLGQEWEQVSDLEWECLAREVQVGDCLVAVNEEDVSTMEASAISRLIASKKENPVRKCGNLYL